MLRGVLLGVGVVLLLGAGGMALLGAAGAVPAAILGAVLVLAILVARRRYKSTLPEAPGAGWQDTGERFIDPVSGEKLTVFFHPASGERRYVASATRDGH